MRCLILIALSLVLANARQDFNKLRFSRLLRSYQNGMDNEFQPRRQLLGGLHDVIGRGVYYPVQGDEEFSGPENWEQYGEESETEPWTRQQRGGQCFGEECEYEQEQDQYEQEEYPTGRRHSQYQQNQYNQFQDQDQDEESLGGEYENEFEQQQYGKNPFQQQQLRGGQCSPNPRMIPKLEKITYKLATTLYKQARRERDDKNTVVSPAAVLLGLGALSVGAKTHTKKDVCQITGECPTINGLTALVRLLKKGGQSTRYQGMQGMQRNQGWMGQQEEMDEEYGQQCVGRQCTQIKPITAIFLSKQTPAQQSFVQLVQGCLGVKVQKCDFQRQPQQCRQQINQWVSTKTQHKMPRLVPQDSITDNTKMVVVSGLELKAQWGQQFKNHQTKKGIFHPLDTQKVKHVPFMIKRGVFNYHETELVKVVGIPTQGKELTMYVVLPKCKTCLAKVEQEELTEGDELKRLLDNCDQKKKQVNVQLPKFQIKHKLDAKQALLKKGLVNMFEQSKADFSGITGVRGGVQFEENEIINKRTQIHVNKFLHQATIKVTSTGIKAAGPQDQSQDQYEPEEFISQQMRGQHGQQYGQYEDEENMYGEEEEETYMTGRDRYEQIMGMNRFGQQQGSKKQFKADHPFVFVVRHNPTKQVLLMGRVIDAGQKTTTTEGPQMEELYPSQGIY